MIFSHVKISYFLRVFKYDFSQWPKTLYNTYVNIIKNNLSIRNTIIGSWLDFGKGLWRCAQTCGIIFLDFGKGLWRCAQTCGIIFIIPQVCAHLHKPFPKSSHDPIIVFLIDKLFFIIKNLHVRFFIKYFSDRVISYIIRRL